LLGLVDADADADADAKVVVFVAGLLLLLVVVVGFVFALPLSLGGVSSWLYQGRRRWMISVALGCGVARGRHGVLES